MILNNFGMYYNEQARYKEAEPLLRRALAIWEESLGPEHPNVATALCNCLNGVETEGKYSEAATALQRSLAIWERPMVRGIQRSQVPSNNLGVLQRTLRNYPEQNPIFGVRWRFGKRPLDLNTQEWRTS